MLYELRRKYYYKDNKKIEENIVKEELGEKRFNSLLKLKKLNVRKINPNKKITNIVDKKDLSKKSINNKTKKLNTLKNISKTDEKIKSNIINIKDKKISLKNNFKGILINSDDKKDSKELKFKNSIEKKIFLKERPLYHVEKSHHKEREKAYELWRKNPKYGYCNFCCYLENNSEYEISSKILENLLEFKQR